MIIKVRVIPNSSRNDVVGRIGSILRVKISAPAVEGKANEELCCFLAEFFDVKRRMVFLRKGERGREKTIEICGRSEEELEEVLETVP
ncbi:MAG: YggU family protein [Endomicrobiales bacterium]|nr:YggU family protein [Endomicrobiales bacterium]